MNARPMNARSLSALLVICAGLAVPAVHADDGQKLDHSDLDALLKKYVDDKGTVDYKTWKAKDSAGLDAYVKKLADVKGEDKLSKNERLALWINAYNALTIQWVLAHYPATAKMDSLKPWKNASAAIAGQTVTPDDIEHKILRKMGEPRIHFAIVCASRGCPYLRPGAFTGDKLDEQLEEQVQKAFSDPAKLKIDRAKKTVYALKVLDWFGEDFGASKVQRLTWIGKHVKDADDRKVCLDNDASLEFLDWDWTINER